MRRSCALYFIQYNKFHPGLQVLLLHNPAGFPAKITDICRFRPEKSNKKEYLHFFIKKCSQINCYLL